MVVILKVLGILSLIGSFSGIVTRAPGDLPIMIFFYGICGFAAFGWMSDGLQYLKEINKNIRRMAQIAEEDWRTEEANPLLEGAPKTRKRHPFFNK